MKLVDCQRGTKYCWACGQCSFETNKWTMFLETEASFPYCNWSTKMVGIIWLGSTSVQHVYNWQRFSRLPFLSLCKSRKFLETKTYYFNSIKKKIICKKKFQKIWWKYGLHQYLPQAQQHLPPLYLICITILRTLSQI